MVIITITVSVLFALNHVFEGLDLTISSIFSIVIGALAGLIFGFSKKGEFEMTVLNQNENSIKEDKNELTIFRKTLFFENNFKSLIRVSIYEEIYNPFTGRYFYSQKRKDYPLMPEENIDFVTDMISSEKMVLSYKVFIKFNRKINGKSNHLFSLNKNGQIDFYNKEDSKLRRMSSKRINKLISQQENLKIREQDIYNFSVEKFVKKLNLNNQLWERKPTFTYDLWIPYMVDRRENNHSHWGIGFLIGKTETLFYALSEEDETFGKKEMPSMFVYIDHIKKTVFYRNHIKKDDSGKEIKYYYSNRTRDIETSLLHGGIIEATYAKK